MKMIYRRYGCGHVGNFKPNQDWCSSEKQDYLRWKYTCADKKNLCYICWLDKYRNGKLINI